MKIGKDEINRIRQIALSNYEDQSPNLSWTNGRGEINQSERRTLAYVQAINIVLDLDLEVEYYKQVSLFAWERAK